MIFHAYRSGDSLLDLLRIGRGPWFLFRSTVLILLGKEIHSQHFHLSRVPSDENTGDKPEY